MNTSSIAALKSREIFIANITDGLNFPASIAITDCLETFNMSANFCWVNPFSLRNIANLFSKDISL